MAKMVKNLPAMQESAGKADINLRVPVITIQVVFKKKKKTTAMTSLEVQWLRLHTSSAGVVGLIPGQGVKIPHAP